MRASLAPYRATGTHVVNLNSDPSTRKHGKAIEGSKFMPRTRTNVTTLEVPKRCPRCHYFPVDHECMCTIIEGQPQKPVVTNKAGNPYSVAWQSHATATVFHPGDLEYYTVNIDPHGHYTCRGRSDGERCWPFQARATCPHCEAVENSILLGEAPAYKAPAGVLVGRVTTIDLDDDPLVRLFDYSR